MATFELQNREGTIRQANQGDTFGELWGTKHIDLNSSVGKVKVSKKLQRVFANNDVIGGPNNYEGKIRALLIYTNLDAAADRKHYYAFSDDSGYRCDIDADVTDPANWEVSPGSSNKFSNSTDAVVFDGQIRISTSTNIAKFNGGATFADDWWTADIAGTALTTGKPHTLHVHRGGQETILVTDSNLVRYYNATAGHTTLTLATSLVANTLASGVDTVWVGTYAETSENAYVYEFNIGNTLPNAAYRIDAQAVMSLETIDNIPYIVTEKGEIMGFNGSGFSLMPNGEFPFAKQSKSLNGVKPGIFSYSSPPVFPKGMRASGRSLLINIATTGTNATIQPIDERTPSGVWEYNIDTQILNHRYALSDETTDYGTFRLNEAGPILPVGSDTVTILVGGGTTLDGLYVDSDETPEGYIITPEYYGDSITQAWEKVTATAFLNGGSITAKYRTEKRAGYPLYVNTVTWLNATQFTTTADLSLVEVGDEVEVISVDYTGRLCHITAIEGTTTKTVTVDESIGVLNATSNVRFQNWKKLSDEYTSGTFQSIGIGQDAPFVQLKLQLTGNVELQKLTTKGNAKVTH